MSSRENASVSGQQQPVGVAEVIWEAVNDESARNDWGWAPQFDLAGMTDQLLPEIRALLAERADALDHQH